MIVHAKTLIEFYGQEPLKCLPPDFEFRLVHVLGDTTGCTQPRPGIIVWWEKKRRGHALDGEVAIIETATGKRLGALRRRTYGDTIQVEFGGCESYVRWVISSCRDVAMLLES